MVVGCCGAEQVDPVAQLQAGPFLRRQCLLLIQQPADACPAMAKLRHDLLRELLQGHRRCC